MNFAQKCLLCSQRYGRSQGLHEHFRQARAAHWPQAQPFTKMSKACVASKWLLFNWPFAISDAPCNPGPVAIRGPMLPADLRACPSGNGDQAPFMSLLIAREFQGALYDAELTQNFGSQCCFWGVCRGVRKGMKRSPYLFCLRFDVQ